MVDMRESVNIGGYTWVCDNRDPDAIPAYFVRMAGGDPEKARYLYDTRTVSSSNVRTTREDEASK